MPTPSLRGAKDGVKSLFRGAKSGVAHVSGKLASVSTRSSSSQLQEEEDTTHVARLATAFFPSQKRQIALDTTYGLVMLTVEDAELKDAAQYFVSVSIGTQTFSSNTSEVTATPKWGAGRNLVLQQEDATVARLSLYRVFRSIHMRRRKQELVAWCDVDLATYFDKELHQDHDSQAPGRRILQQPVAPGRHACILKDPADSSRTVGNINLSIQSTTLENLEHQFWGRVLGIADLNGDAELSLEEFVMLMQAFGSDLTEEETAELYRRADADHSGSVSEDELANCLAASHADGELSKLIKRCPVSGAELVPGDDWGNIIYMTMCMDQGSGQGLQTGSQGPQEAAQGKNAWMLKMSEWAPHTATGTLQAAKSGAASTFDPSAAPDHHGHNTAHIIVYDRKSKRLVEEIISPHLILAMRKIYQSRMGYLMMKTGTLNTLELMSKEEGRHMDSPESIKTIPGFLKEFGGEVDMSEALEPTESFKTFNEFFFRKLKPSARPIASPEHPDVLVSAADCRLTAFTSVDDATRCWIKGRRFSIAGLLADKAKKLSPEYDSGSMLIFRLAPQDYHRFHFPVSGTLVSITDVRGKLYTVNPIAVSSTFANVFTENKRAVCLIDSPEFGQVAFVAIGATMVGSIRFTAEVGKTYAKGDEMGYFAFGGSTTIALFRQDAVVFDPDIVSNSQRSLETLVKMGERLGVTPASPLRHSESAKVASLQELESHVGHILPLDQAQAQMDDFDGEGHDGKHAPRIHTAVPLGASPKAASHPSEFGSDSDEEDGGAVQALTHV